VRAMIRPPEKRFRARDDLRSQMCRDCAGNHRDPDAGRGGPEGTAPMLSDRAGTRGTSSRTGGVWFAALRGRDQERGGASATDYHCATFCVRFAL